MDDITLVGIDTGGTFTDMVVLDRGLNSGDIRHCKVLSDPSDPSAPIVEGLQRLGLENKQLQIILGTTVATNAVLEGKGARVAQAVAKLAKAMGCDVLEAARGIVRLANEHIARALKVISVERGHDPADYALLCFGGAGGLHACDLAELLNMKHIIIPARAGVFSAMGMLVSEPGRELSHAVLKPLAALTDDEIGQWFRALEVDARTQLADEGCESASVTFRHQLELRYQGQSATISINWFGDGAHATSFHQAHKKASGLCLPHPVELVNIRLSARAPAVLKSIDIKYGDGCSSAAEMIRMPERACEVPLRHRHSLRCGEWLQGPCILTESVSTTWVQPGWKVRLDTWGNLLLNHDAG